MPKRSARNSQGVVAQSSEEPNSSAKRPRSNRQSKVSTIEPSPAQRDPSVRVTRAVAANLAENLGSEKSGPSAPAAEAGPSRPRAAKKSSKRKQKPSMSEEGAPPQEQATEPEGTRSRGGPEVRKLALLFRGSMSLALVVPLWTHIGTRCQTRDRGHGQ